MEWNSGWGCVLLAGGEARRMEGRYKGGLPLEGASFESRICGQLEELGVPCFVSAGKQAAGQPRQGWRRIRDEETARDERGRRGPAGPLGGMSACLSQSGQGGLFFVPCDMPLFRKELALLLLRHRRREDQLLLWRTRDGRVHPLCGFYRADCAPILKRQLSRGRYRLGELQDMLCCRIVDTASEHVPDSWFANINTAEEYRRLLQKTGRKGAAPPVLAVAGRKNSGKTALLERLVGELAGRGIRTAVIKHDGHDFEADAPGTDSRRLKEAGALGTVVYSSSRFCLVKEEAGKTAADFLTCFPEADLVLMEGQKQSSWPKLELLRAGEGMGPICCREGLLAYVSVGQSPDRTREQFALEPRIPVIAAEDTGSLLELAVSRIDGGWSKTIST